MPSEVAPDSLNPAIDTFLAIHRTGSISAASEALHLSQPAVTRRLQTLERRLGAPLFDRTRGGLRLSAAGEVLLPHAERGAAVPGGSRSGSSVRSPGAG
jgi:molybdate transport repressor ModE-like protein